MSLHQHRITEVVATDISTHYPRTIGRNARLGSHGSGPTSRAVILCTDTGYRGWGLLGRVAADPRAAVGQSVGDLIDPDIGVLSPELSSLDFALHDLAGVILGEPVHQMLGARGPRSVPIYDGAIYMDDLDPDESPRGLEAVLANCAADDALGFRAFKLKIGRGHRWLDREAGDDRDVAVTRTVRETYPDHRILVDANDGYDGDGFLRYLDRVADCGLYWIEEPFLDDAADLARLRAALDRQSPDTMIAEGESNPQVDDLLKIADDGSIDVLLMDVVSFGLTSWRKIMPQVVDTGTRASPHAWGLPLKTLYAAQMAAGLGNIPIVEGVPGATEGVDTSGYVLADGELTLPDQPGFGIPLPN